MYFLHIFNFYLIVNLPFILFYQKTALAERRIGDKNCPAVGFLVWLRGKDNVS